MSAPDIRRRRSQSTKLVVTGPFDAGKTTFIKTVSDTTVLSTERSVTGPGTEGSSGGTTVAMDFGRIGVEPDLALFLFGTPGQERFDFMWDILAEGMLGFVLIVDASRPTTLEESAQLRRRFTAATTEVPHVVAINKADPQQDHAALITRVREELGLSDQVPVLVADVRERDDVHRVLLAFLRDVLDRVRGSSHQLSSVGGMS